MVDDAQPPARAARAERAGGGQCTCSASARWRCRPRHRTAARRGRARGTLCDGRRTTTASAPTCRRCDRVPAGGRTGAGGAIRAAPFQPRRIPTTAGGSAGGVGGGASCFEHGIPLLDLALWLGEFPEPRRVTAYMHRRAGAAGRRPDARAARMCQRRLLTRSTCRGRTWARKTGGGSTCSRRRMRAALAAARDEGAERPPVRRVAAAGRRGGTARSSSRTAPSWRTFWPSSAATPPVRAAGRPGDAAPDRRGDLPVGRARGTRSCCD